MADSSLAQPSDSDDVFGCQDLGGVFEFSSQMFLFQSSAGLVGFRNSALLTPLPGQAANHLQNWLEVIYTDKGIQFANRLPELGLPLSLYNVRIDVLDRMGVPITTNRLFEDGDCQGLSLFPGQKSRIFKMPDMPHALQENHADLRVRVRILGAEL